MSILNEDKTAPIASKAETVDLIVAAHLLASLHAQPNMVIDGEEIAATEDENGDDVSMSRLLGVLAGVEEQDYENGIDVFDPEYKQSTEIIIADETLAGIGTDYIINLAESIGVIISPVASFVIDMLLTEVINEVISDEMPALSQLTTDPRELLIKNFIGAAAIVAHCTTADYVTGGFKSDAIIGELAKVDTRLRAVHMINVLCSYRDDDTGAIDLLDPLGAFFILKNHPVFSSYRDSTVFDTLKRADYQPIGRDITISEFVEIFESGYYQNTINVSPVCDDTDEQG